ncbi:Sec-independent protein translocase subunit TatA [Demequina capsici]|uniref:Sec-independent protein translocase protein TatA n=1 Tax=Demequina capsici TaxID=3075620 RepID=A0AA96FEU7_9MICO|nr:MULTISPECIES: Sec-independent protein translocase subunit TatA [unclassified Demequina]WNM25808.1 Sec-independent protein translocase subunit TatA [Demequina sp. OYTSA14]WNM28703.1 Sec-independent protein translocase subunit TatA [Demequina sp. PMTSA13]
MGSFGAREWIIIAVIVLILFGAPKLPEFARSLGKSMRILKEETKSLTSDDSSEGKSSKGTEAGDGEASDK